jgi:hypothetical protein
VRETRRNHEFLDGIGFFDGKDRDREVYRKLVATYCEITKYSRMYYAVERLGLLGEPYPGNPVMFQFRFVDARMKEFYWQLVCHAGEHGLDGFAEYFLDTLKHFEQRK